MSREVLTLKQAAEHVHLDANELKHVAQRGEIDAIRRGDEWLFEHRALDEWAQRNLLAANKKAFNAQYRAMMDENRRDEKTNWGIAGLFRPELVTLELQSKAKAGVLRDLTDLADRSGLLNDPEALYRELSDREEAASTAIGHEAAIPHPRFHDPYLVTESFIAYARATRPVFFGDANGEGTRHFFMICSTDHAAHLHILARLATLINDTDLLARLDLAADADAALTAIAECERGCL